MNEELKRLLDNARAAGANASQLQGIVDAYNVKKKETPAVTENAVIGGEIGGTVGGSKAQSEEPVNEYSTNLLDPAKISSFKNKELFPKGAPVAVTEQSPVVPEMLFSGDDKSELAKLSQKHNVTPFGFNPINEIKKSAGLGELVVEDNIEYRPFVAEITDAKAVESNLSKQLLEKRKQLNTNLFKDDAKTINKTKDEISALEKDLKIAKTLRNKAAAELAIEGEDVIDANIRTDESGNLLNKTTNRLMAISPNTGTSAIGLFGISQETQDRVDELPPQFVTGLNYLKNSEPVIFERVTDALQKGLPISESQVATITQQGIELEQARLQRKLQNQEISDVDFSTKMLQLNTVRKHNLLDNKETLRAFLSDGAANILDELGKINQVDVSPVVQAANYAFGHTWNYSDKEIKYAAEQYAKKNGLDPQDGRVQEAIRFLQDNEGSMIMENSIAKAGGVRELFKGLAEPIRGIASSVEDLGKSSNDVYVESQSQGNANVSEKRLKLEDTGVRGVVNDVVKGTGQFVTQAGLAYLTSGAVGTAGKALLGAADAAAIESGVALTEATTADIIGKSLLGTKDGIATFITSYAQAYDSNLKSALSYTSDNQLAKQVASVNSALEGATELFLSPLDIAKGIGAKFASKSVTEDLLKVLSDKNLMQNPDKLRDFLSKTLKGVSGTAYVAGAEIGEEYVTQIADYVTNATLNPNSQTFQNRDLANELALTAYDTGLSMAIPALLNGIGAANANSFSKGSLLVAAQNRQKLIEGLDEDLALNNIGQDEYNEKVRIVNTAAVANANLPLKADGGKLTTDEKADYIFSITSEEAMKNKIEKSKDEAEKRVLEGKIKTQQDFRTELLGTPTVAQQIVSDELATDAAVTEQQQNSTPETNIIPALKEKITNVAVENDEELLSYAIDKVAEAPSKMMADLGEPLFNQVLAQVPTEKLQENLDFLLDKNPDSEDVVVLDKEISKRENISSSNTQTNGEDKTQADAQAQEQGQVLTENGNAASENGAAPLPKNKKERLAAFKNKYVEPVQPTATEQKQWNELSMTEKLALAKENLPEVDNLSNVEAVKVADDNAKMLLGKLNQKAPEVTTTEVVSTETKPADAVVPENKNVEQADIETRKKALKDLMDATGVDIYQMAVEDGSFNGEGFLDMDKDGNVILTRFADSRENLTKDGKVLSPEELEKAANNHSNQTVSTSAIEGGMESYAKENGVIGKYKIPIKELMKLMKEGYVHFAGIGNKEFVLSPHIAEKYLDSVNGEKISKPTVVGDVVVDKKYKVSKNENGEGLVFEHDNGFRGLLVPNGKELEVKITGIPEEANRGKGFGKEGYEAILDYAKENGYDTVKSAPMLSDQAYNVWKSLSKKFKSIKESGNNYDPTDLVKTKRIAENKSHIFEVDVKEFKKEQSLSKEQPSNKQEVVEPKPEIKKLEAERDAEIDKVSKPDLKLELVSSKELVDSKDPIGNRQKHNEIKERYKNLRKLIECL